MTIEMNDSLCCYCLKQDRCDDVWEYADEFVAYCKNFEQVLIVSDVVSH